MRTRREWLKLCAQGFMVAAPVAALGAAAGGDNDVEVWKSATCGCCRLWVDHMRGHGFRPKTQDVEDMNFYKRKYGVPARLVSCHTALVGGYVLEGHVPADVVRQMLKERPKIVGLAVPGMPMGSPGMEGSRKDPYDVVAFDKAGQTRVYAKR